MNFRDAAVLTQEIWNIIRSWVKTLRQRLKERKRNVNVVFDAGLRFADGVAEDSEDV